MKHRTRKYEDLLVTECAELGISVEAVEADLLLEYLEWLLETNRLHNLTSITTLEGGVRLHLVDCLSATPEVLACPEGPILDIGTGGGLPGLPLAIHCEREAYLLDSTRKKVELLADFVRTRGLKAHAVAARAEEYAMAHPCEFPCVVARAVAPLPSLVELAAPLMPIGGRLVCLKGSPSSEETARGTQAAAVCGLVPSSTRGFVLPDGGQQRTIVVYERVRAPEIALPRAVGRAQKRPLA